jgi:hypothetical protein
MIKLIKLGSVALVACVMLAASSAAQTPDQFKTQKERDIEAQKKVEAEKKEADKKTADPVKPPAVIPPGQSPDSWKMSMEKEKGTPEPAKAETPKVAKETPAKAKPAKDEKTAAEEKLAAKEQSAKESKEKKDKSKQKSDEKPRPADSQARASKTPAPPKPKKPWHGWSDRAFLSLNAGLQSSSRTFSNSRTFDPALPGDTERRTMKADYSVDSGTSLDLGGTFRVWKGLGVGLAVTSFKNDGDIAVSGSVPHPFFFNRFRSVSGTEPGTRQETGVHINAVWVVPINRKVHLALFGGPSFYSVKQTVVTNFTISESYPYDEATLASIVASDESGSVTGFNAGADFGYYFTDMIGVGGVVRIGSASLDSTLGSLDVGGPSFGVGLRVRIPQGKSKSPRP